MNFLPKDKEKRTHFLLVIAGTAGLLAAIGFGVIRQQYATLQKIAEQSTSERKVPEDQGHHQAGGWDGQ